MKNIITNDATSVQLLVIRQHRIRLAVIGSIFILAGLMILQAPYIFFDPLQIILSFGLILSGGLKLVQLVLGKSSKGYSLRGIVLILVHSLLDIGAGILFLTHDNLSIGFIALILGVLFTFDGAVQFAVAWRSRGTKSRFLFFLNACFTLFLGLSTIILIPQLRVNGVVFLLAARLISFGAILLVMAYRSKDNSLPIIFTEIEPEVVRRKRGELYACYFGSGFHLGVYIGNNEVVHYRDDSIVHRTSWEEFLRGREPQHWVYPDIKSAPVNVVIKTAIAQAGKKMKYNLIYNNCEHFAIYCKTGGKDRDSLYAQTSSAMRNLKQRPYLAVFVEAYTRAGEWLAFHFGGTFGHRVSYKIRRLNSMVTAWMLSSKKPSVKN
jgi:uncharacterized membrane protein HdeD (DUF308 family)